jgi:hypothetical protein
MSNGQQFTKFFWTDWNNDPALNLCSHINQYLWFKMLGIAAQHDPQGYVAVNNRGLNPEDIARIIGWDIDVVKAGVNELDKAGVFSRNSEGIIFSRRMVRDAEMYLKFS